MPIDWSDVATSQQGNAPPPPPPPAAAGGRIDWSDVAAPQQQQQVPAAPTRSLWTTGEWDPQAQQWQTTYEGPNKPDEAVAPTAPAQATGLSRLIPMVGEEFQQQYQPMAEELHRLNQAAGRGQLWSQIKQDFPPSQSATDTLINAYGSLLPLALKRAPDGSIDWLGTMAASTGKAAALIGPAFLHMSPEERSQLPDQVKAAIPDILGDMRDVYQSAADNVRDFLVGHPKTVKGAAQVVGGTLGAGAGALLGADLPGHLGPLAGARYGAKYGGRAAEAFLRQITPAEEEGAAAAGPAAAGPPAPAPTPPTPAAPPQAAPEPAAPSAAPTGDDIAREYGYKNEQEAIADVGRGAWQIAKAQGRAAGRPVGAPPPVAEPPAAARPAPAAAPAPESTLTQQLRASLAQEPAVEPARDPQVVQAIHDAADKLDDAGMLQTFRAQQEYERQVTELEKGRAYLAAQGMEHGTKQMLAAAAGEAPPETWTKLPNWTAADEQRIDAMLASHDIKASEGELQPVTQRGQALLDQMQRENAQTAANRAAAAARVAQPYGTPQFSPESEGYGAQNKFITQERYEAAKASLDAKIAKLNQEGYHAGVDPFKIAALIPEYMEMGAYHLEAGLKNFADWSEQMLKEGGESVRPYLQPMWSRLTEGQDSGQRISQRVPTGKLAFEDPAADVLQAGREAVDADPGSLKPRLAAALREADIPGLKLTAKMSDDQVLDAYTKHAADNLVWLYNQVPEDVRKLTMQWYDGARTLATQLAEKHGLSNHQVAGVLASLSPSTDWYMNVSLAKRVIDTYLNQQDTMTTPEMLKLARERGMTGEAKALRGKTLGELDTNEEKGWWVRLYDEAHAPNQNYDIIAPDGSTVGPWRTQKGQGPPGKLIWQSNDNIMKAIAILDDGSRENIQGQLSKGYHKVPSFYNNIIAPNDPAGDVTVDTHAVAAAQLRPLGSSHPDVTANFSGPGSKHTGSNGTYPLNADAYRIAAERLGLQPRQLQSVTWEAARDLFPDTFKTKQAKMVANGLSDGTIDGVWRDYQSGKISINKARQQIVKIAAPNGFPKSYWQQFLK